MSNQAIKDCTPAELIAIVLSRSLEDGWVVEPGVSTDIPMAACKLAQATFAPNLHIYSSATGILNAGGPLSSSSADYAVGETNFGPVRYGFIWLGYTQKMDGFFASGLQVDQHGNVNLVGIGKDIKKLQFRGPGFTAHSALAWIRNIYIFMRHHTKRTFVERVDWISAPGFLGGPGDREMLGLPPGGPQLVVSPIAVLDFEEKSKVMRLKSVHPWATVDEVIEKTGFKLVIPPIVPETDLSVEELETLRTQVDIHGLLQKIDLT